MRTIKLLAILTIMMLGATATFGQTFYYSVEKGGVVIDCTMMPEGTVLTKSMATGEDSQLPSHAELDSENRVYPLLVVAMNDLVDKIVPYQSGDTSKDTALSLVKAYNGGGFNDWRLPNQRELMMIWVLHEEIAKYMQNVAGDFESFQQDFYWSSTDDSPNRWVVNFKDGKIGSGNANTDRYARAVREIDLTTAE